MDEHWDTYGSPVGLLHGLPISLKDSFHVRGHDTHMGYVGWIGTYEGRRDAQLVHQVNSQIVTELLSLGAIVYCKASPQATVGRGDFSDPSNVCCTSAYHDKAALARVFRLQTSVPQTLLVSVGSCCLMRDASLHTFPVII